LEPSSHGPIGSLVERLSGKPVELAWALPKVWGSWQAGGRGYLTPGWCLSQHRSSPIIPHRAGAQQGLMGEPSRRGGGLVIPHIPGAQQGPEGSGLSRLVSR
jgi:hypothetical protein